MASSTFLVEDIHCGACEVAIRKALTRLDGVRDVGPDAASNRVSVVYDETQVSEEVIAQRLAAAGYPVVTR